jgi:hypothetical protein
MKRIMVTLNDAQYKELRRCEMLGETDAEKMRNAFVVYVEERFEKKKRKR